MRPFSQQIRPGFGLRPWKARVLVLTAVCCLFLSGCDEEKQEPEEPTEPWLKDEPHGNKQEAPTFLRYRLREGQALSLALPTRKSKPTGKLPQISGHFDVALSNLETSTGRIQVNLDRIEMDEPTSPPEHLPDDAAPPETAKRTVQALRWLGLGTEVSEEQASKRKTAVFEITALRAVSHQSAYIGARTKNEDGSEVRKVRATAEGELALRSFSVHRQIPVVLAFHFAEAAGSSSQPTHVEITLSGTNRVPLAEYEIVPRNAAGDPIADQMARLGRDVGTSAVITGSLTFEKVGPE